MTDGRLWETFVTVVSAPSGTGKTTLCHAVLKELDNIRFSVSHTTRAPRGGEVDGKDYFFVNEREFLDLIAQDAFVEWAQVYGNYYGTSRAELARAEQDGVDLMVEIDVQGAKQILGSVPDAVGIFILPPSLAELERRLRDRGTDAEAAIRTRLDISRAEIDERHNYQYWIVNDHLETAIDEACSIIRAQRSTRSRDKLDFNYRQHGGFKR